MRALLRGFLRDIHEREQSHVVHCVLTVEGLEEHKHDDKRVAMLLKRCHENLGHPSTPRFIGMLKAARATEKCIQIAKGLTCTTCDQFQQQKSHHVSKVTPIQHFNDLVAMDTFEVDLPKRKLKILNIIDLATHFQVCVPLWKGIEIRKIRKAYRRFWKRWAGHPKKVITDGGKEFGQDWTDMLFRDGSIHDVTAAYGPWQNGVCERAGSTWKTAFQKGLLEVDPQSKEEVEELVDQVLCARNMLVRKEGYSPCQHVLGQDVRIPGSILMLERHEHMESALEQGERTHERAHRIRLAARKAFLEVDSADRLRRAMSHRTRPKRGPFHPCQEVLIWRKGRGQTKCHWQGPGRVVGVHSDKVWVAFGAKVYRCCPEKVRHQSKEVQDLARWIPENLRRHRNNLRERGAGNVVELDRQPKPPDSERGNDMDMNVDLEHGMHDMDDTQMHERHWPQEFQVDSDQNMEPQGSQTVGTCSYSPSLGMSDPPDVVSQESEGQSDDGTQHGVAHENNDQHVGTHDMEHEHEGHTDLNHVADETAGPVPAVQVAGIESAGDYGPVRTTRLTEAMRRSLDRLGFGRAKHDMPRKHDVESMDDALECDMMHETYMKRKLEHACECHVVDEVFVAAVKKAGRKEINTKNLTPARLEELTQAKAK